MPNKTRFLFIFALLVFASFVNAQEAEEEAVDASDPTKIYTYAGGGIKYTDYTNGESMVEARITGNLGISKSDMALFELGYGWHDGDLVAGKNSDLTNSRIRYFHLFPMDYSVVSGFRGMAGQVDLQLAGDLKGTNGQNTLSIGGLGAFGLNQSWSLYAGANLVNTWDEKFKDHKGVGIAGTALLVFSPEKLWPGAYIQIWPSYSYFVSGDLKKTGSGNLDLITGGSITSRVLWSVTFQKLVDKNISSFPRGPETGLVNDWNIFANVTSYF